MIIYNFRVLWSRAGALLTGTCPFGATTRPGTRSSIDWRMTRTTLTSWSTLIIITAIKVTSCFMFAPINFKLSSPSNILTFSQVWLSAGQPRHSAPSLSPGPSETWSQPFLLIWRNARIQQRWLPWDKKRNVNTIKNMILMKYNFLSF